MKSIHTLIPDIYSLIKRKDGWFTEEFSKLLSEQIAKNLKGSLGQGQRPGTLRLSKMRPECPKALWYSVRHPELGEPLPPWAEIKYSFGHIIEALTISLAKETGHSVEGEQDELELDGIVGHRDCVIDGHIVDVKSSSSRAFSKFKSRDIAHSDNFGYLDQLDGYVLASRYDPLVHVKDKGYLLAVDKQLGHMCLYEHTVTSDREATLRKRIVEYKAIVGRSDPPACECKSISQGGSGNMQLDLKASYSSFKYCCNPKLRTFIYAGGPVYLTTVVRKPDVPEMTAQGKYLYN